VRSPAGRLGGRRRALLVVSIATVGVLSVAGLAGARSDSPVYETDFADPAVASEEWEFSDGATEETGDGYSLALTAGELQVTLDGAKNLWLNPDAGRLPKNQYVEATIGTFAGDESELAGVICRGSLDDDLGYAFLLGFDGYYTIADFSGKGVRKLVNKGGDTTGAVGPVGPNVVRGECTSISGGKVRLTMFVNGVKVASAIDTSPAKVGPRAYLLTEVEAGSIADVTYTSFAVGEI
jgi:hypothetical protein